MTTKNEDGIFGAVAGLLASRKAIIVIVAIGVVAALGFTHNIEGDKVIEFVKWVVVSWLGAQAYEDAKIKSAALFTPPSPPNNGSTTDDP